MKMLIFRMLLLVLFLGSCNENSTEIDETMTVECTPQNWDTIELTENSQQWYMYEDGEKAIFKDSLNNEYDFLIEFSSGEFEYQEMLECDDANDLIITFIRQMKTVTLHCPDNLEMKKIELELTTGFERDETDFVEENLIDILKIVRFGDDFSITTQIVTSVRESNYNLEILNDLLVYHEDFEIFGNSYGETYQTIYSYSSPIEIHSQISLSPNLGIVSLRDFSNKILIFDRIE